MPLRQPGNPLSEFEARLLRDKVFKIIQDKSFSKGEFTLTSGKTSPYYLDVKLTMLDPEGAEALSLLILDRLKHIPVDYVGGLAVGAVPLITNIIMLSAQQRAPLPGFFVRKERKDHGTMQLIEGLVDSTVLKGKAVVILDDVTTTGESAMIAGRAAQNKGARVILVLSVVDRQEGASEFYKGEGVPFDALFTAGEFMAAA